MNGVIFFLFAISVILIVGMFHFLLKSQQSGVYPPKQLLRQKAGALGVGGVLFFLIGFLFYQFI
ncbi:hypothetical protein B1NLA3E_03865 [Bacillus sp. 1NLA3E]|nr:hypothetical protein [Bacillus sp. 1NLA3E]AGK52549.1 hypothetical protein B1NLA3E_03865 [Bacillus sp. 1NLA3E]